jgi:hypothetical protein
MTELYLGDCVSSTVNVAGTVLTQMFRMPGPGTLWRHSHIDVVSEMCLQTQFSWEVF